MSNDLYFRKLKAARERLALESAVLGRLAQDGAKALPPQLAGFRIWEKETAETLDRHTAGFDYIMELLGDGSEGPERLQPQVEEALACANAASFEFGLVSMSWIKDPRTESFPTWQGAVVQAAMAQAARLCRRAADALREAPETGAEAETPQALYAALRADLTGFIEGLAGLLRVAGQVLDAGALFRLYLNGVQRSGELLVSLQRAITACRRLYEHADSVIDWIDAQPASDLSLPLEDPAGMLMRAYRSLTEVRDMYLYIVYQGAIYCREQADGDASEARSAVDPALLNDRPSPRRLRERPGPANDFARRAGRYGKQLRGTAEEAGHALRLVRQVFGGWETKTED